MIMNAFFISALLLSFFLLTNLLKSKRRIKNSHLPPIPPDSRFISGHLHLLKKPLHQTLARLSALHGPILLLRFGVRRVIVVSSAALAEECFTAKDLCFASRPRFPSSRLSTYNYSGIGSAPYGPQWRDMRRIATIEVLSGHRLAFFSNVRAGETRNLIRKLYEDSNQGGFTRVELRERLFGFAMNVMMKMIAGKGYYGYDSDDGDARRFREIVEEGLSLAGVSNVGDFLPWVFGWFARRRVRSRLERIHRFRDGFMQGIVDEHRRKMTAEEEEEAMDERKNHKTLIGAMLSLQRKHPEVYDDSFIKSLVTVSSPF